jgi:large conductance mechanosensitive channel
MKKFFQEFKTFAMRGNVMDMAIGIIIGGAFGKIISSLVADVIMPCIGVFVGGINFADLKVTLKESVVDAAGEIIPAVTLNYGVLIQVIFDFIIIAFCIFLVIKAINKMSRKKEEAPAEPPQPSDEVKLLTEIRDALKERK